MAGGVGPVIRECNSADTGLGLLTEIAQDIVANGLYGSWNLRLGRQPAGVLAHAKILC
jgi:hypothetical protein